MNRVEEQVNYDGESEFEHFCLNDFSQMVQAVRDLDIESLTHGFPGFERQKDSFSLRCKPYYTIRKTERKQEIVFKDSKTNKIVGSYEADVWEINKKDENGNYVVLRTGTESSLVRAYYHMMLVLAEGVKNYVSGMRQN